MKYYCCGCDMRATARQLPKGWLRVHVAPWGTVACTYVCLLEFLSQEDVDEAPLKQKDPLPNS